MTIFCQNTTDKEKWQSSPLSKLPYDFHGYYFSRLYASESKHSNKPPSQECDITANSQ